MDPRNIKPAATPPAVNKEHKQPETKPAIDPLKRLEELEDIVLEGAETIKNMDLAVTEIGQENEAMRRRLREVLDVEEPKRPWNWKRIAWATVSGSGGLALAWFLRTRQPILNHAASASLGMMAFERIRPLKGFKALGGAITGLSSRWAHDNFEALEIGMAGAGYAYATFQIGEASADGFQDGWKKGVERIKALKARLRRSTEVAEETETQPEGEGHASE